MSAPLYDDAAIEPKPTPPKVIDPRLLPTLMQYARDEHVRWVGWKYELNDKNKWTKVPKKVNGRNASNNDPRTWSTFRPIWERYRAGKFDGIGLMLLGLPDFAAIDFDKVRDPDTGALLPWVDELIASCGSYTEVTPSMKGMRVLGGWSGDKIHRNGPHPGGGGFELFANCERYITFTGLADGTTGRWNDITPQVERLRALLDRPRSMPAAEGGDNIALEGLSEWVIELVKEGKSEGRKVKQRGPQFFKVIKHLHKAGYSEARVVDLFGRYPDGVGGKYTGRLAEEVGRTWAKLDAPARSNLPVITLHPGKVEEQAREALATLGDAGFYQRAGEVVVVKPVKAKASDNTDVVMPAISRAPDALVSGRMSDRAYFRREDDRCRAPAYIVDMALSLPDAWPFPVLRGVTGTPTLRPDGTLLCEPGYDAATGFFLYHPPKMVVIPPAELLTKADAEAALKVLDALLDEFPFVFDKDKEKGQSAANNPSRSVGLSALMSPVLRPGIGITPIHGITAPKAGTGKSYLMDIASAIAYGDRCGVIAVAPKAEETEKRLAAAALGGRQIIALDNCNGVLGGDFLCQVTERPVLEIRVLGESTLYKIDNTFFVFANGNNFAVRGDAVRRSIQCAMDANEEKPEEREFKAKPVEAVLADRGKYIRAVLIIALAYLHGEGKDQKRPRSLASYEGWSNTVRGALMWLGCKDPVDTMEDLRQDDPEADEVHRIFAAWPSQFLGDKTTIEALLQEAGDGPLKDENGKTITPASQFWLALASVARDKNDPSRISPDRLGWWLRRYAGRVVTTDNGTRKLLKMKRETDRVVKWMMADPR